MSYLEIVNYLKEFSNYTPIISFLGAIIWWDEVLIALSILAAQGVFNIWYILIFFYLWILLSDFLWYLLWKSSFFDWFVNRKYISKLYFRWHKIISSISKKSSFKTLLITKFIYGIRIPTIMYLSKEGLKSWPFFTYTIITNLIWTPIVLLIWYYAWKWVSIATNFSDNLILFLTLIGVIIILFDLLMRFISFTIKKWIWK